MSSHISYMRPMPILKTAFNCLITHPVIFFPFCVVGFIQVLILEIVFFAPRWPLSSIFAPLILKVEGEAFLHYPFNFLLLSKWFQSYYVQVPVYMIFTSFCIAASVYIIDRVNSNRTIKMADVFRHIAAVYVHVLVAAAVAITVLFVFQHLYGLVIHRALEIRSVEGGFFLLKSFVLLTAPYIKLFLSAFTTAIFAFVTPIIVLERRKVFYALYQNFCMLKGTLLIVGIIIVLPALLYVPILLIKTNSTLLASFWAPELWGVLLILGIVVALFIEALQFTAITTFYLLKKEAK